VVQAVAPSALPAIQQAQFTAINTARAAQGLPPLTTAQFQATLTTGRPAQASMGASLSGASPLLLIGLALGLLNLFKGK
jgi:hypothetical protein